MKVISMRTEVTLFFDYAFYTVTLFFGYPATSMKSAKSG
jgi:hypothetical protein